MYCWPLGSAHTLRTSEGETTRPETHKIYSFTFIPLLTLAGPSPSIKLNNIILGGGWGNNGYVGWTMPMSNGWKGLVYQDGPQGYRTQGFPGAPNNMKDAAVALPACGAVALAWDTEHAAMYGWLIGDSFHFHEAQVDMDRWIICGRSSLPLGD